MNVTWKENQLEIAHGDTKRTYEIVNRSEGKDLVSNKETLDLVALATQDMESGNGKPHGIVLQWIFDILKHWFGTSETTAKIIQGEVYAPY